MEIRLNRTYELENAFQFRRAFVIPFPVDKLSGLINLPPHIPEQHTFHKSAIEVVYHALPKLHSPIGVRCKPRVQITYCYKAEIEQVRVEVWKIVEWLACAERSIDSAA